MLDRATRGRPLWQIVAAAAVIAGIGMGIRQVAGLFMKPMTMDLGIGREEFALAIAIANIVWGLMAPIFGIVGDRYGAGRVVVAGALATAAGLVVMWGATSAAMLYGSGVLLGIGVSGVGVSALVGPVARASRPEDRSRAIALVGMGSGIGILAALPYTHLAMDALGWRAALIVLALTALAALPLALAVSGVPAVEHDSHRQGAWDALGEACRHPDFLLLNASFFVCGFHVVFYGTHLPAYLADQGLEPWVAVGALMAVGLFNLLGTWIAGEWGRVLPKRYGLALIYGCRTLVFLGFLFLPVTPLMVLALSAALGVLWLSTIPLTSGLVATFFGTQWMSMLYGVVFLSHQIGSFCGAWFGGLVFDGFKSYDVMWWISAALGIAAALLSLPIRELSVARLAELRT